MSARYRPVNNTPAWIERLAVPHGTWLLATETERQRLSYRTWLLYQIGTLWGERQRERKRRYNTSAKGRASGARYHASDLGRARMQRYNSSAARQMADFRYRAAQRELQLSTLRAANPEIAAFLDTGDVSALLAGLDGAK
jgi:hypothetical protein